MIIRRKQSKGHTSQGTDSRELTNGRKVNKSAVFLTINSNKLATAQDEQKFRNLISYLAHDMEQFVSVLNYEDGRRAYSPYSTRPAKPLKVRYAIEEGPERGLLHTHMLVKGKVFDAGVVQVDLNTTRGFLRQELGWCPRVFAEKAEVNSRIENYMTKSFRQE